MSFRKDFVWGAATAAYQIEGAEETPFGMCIAMTRVRTQKETRIF